ncbi:hypothetical protein [Trinickia acidisoli]|uniref:hypothetical protein n=1 Tax=Trinickia acidisoli TaxID=2767482 RepID=UPI001A8C2ED8|nr:hypothetical protein [Trinickia acidisoli]
MDIQLNFVNRSNDANNSSIVIFQKNVATDFDELHVAWKVIRNCGQGDNHPFRFPMATTVSTSDSYGNFMPQQDATNGQVFQVVRAPSGDVLQLASQPGSSKEVQVRNDLPQGAVNATIYKDGTALALKTSIAPGQKAVFEFKPTVWIGVASQVEQGKLMNSAVMSDINTEISLLGIKSADIVMTGGGPGRLSLPFTFKLENVVMA